MIFWQVASARGCVMIFTLVQWTIGFLATSARTKDEIRLKALQIFHLHPMAYRLLSGEVF